MTTASPSKSKIAPSGDKPIEVTKIESWGDEATDVSSFQDFIATGYFTHTINGFPLLSCLHNDGYLVIVKGEIYHLDVALPSGPGAPPVSEVFDNAYDDHVRSTDNAPAGALIEMSLMRERKCAPKNFESYKYFVICNGDHDRYGDEDDMSPVNLPDEVGGFEAASLTVSFRCLGWFVAKDEGSRGFAAAEAMAKRTLDLRAFQPDMKKIVSAAIAKRISNLASKRDEGRPIGLSEAVNRLGKTAKSPAVGYTLMSSGRAADCFWHRAATVIFWPEKTKTTILVGFDEGSYFGVEVEGRLSSIDEVYAALIPDEAKKIAQPIRQGEWFFIPVAEKNVPEITECAALYKGNADTSGNDESDDDGTNYEGLALPVDHEESSRHVVESESDQEIRIAKDGTIYVHDPIMKHSRGQHAAVSAEGWHRFVKNTAIRSFSVSKVD